MLRSYYCQEETLRKYCEDQSSWKFRLLKSIPVFHLLSGSTSKLPQSFEEYLDASEGQSNNAISTLIGDLLERPVITHENIYSIDYSQIGNCLFEDIDLPESILDHCGVEVIHENDFSPLMRHWFDNTIKNDRCFSWGSFFKEGDIQMSNSIIIMDRYLFKTGVIENKGTKKEQLDKQYLNGCKNISEILNMTIPKSFTGEYQVLFVFDDEQVVANNSTMPLTLKDALLEICKEITKWLYEKKCSIRFEFLGIHNGKNFKDSDDEDFRANNQCLKNLYGLTHDRRILSNYFIVNATHGWNAVDYRNNKQRSKETQTFYYDALFSGIDNPDQAEISNAIPIDYIQSFVNGFVEKLTDAKEGSYCCYRYSVNAGLEQISINDLQNRVLLLSNNPVQVKPWNPTSRLFGRDNRKPKKNTY